MSSVSESIVREYFEFHGLLVRQQRKFIAPTKRENEDIDFLVINPKPEPRIGDLAFVLSGKDLAFLQKAVVVVKGWHTETFTTAKLASAPEILRFAQPATIKKTIREFGEPQDILKILVVPALPQDAKSRDQSIALMREKGVDAAIAFRTMLGELLDGIEANRNYQKSDVLQMLRILKNYDFIREPQMELFKSNKRRRNK